MDARRVLVADDSPTQRRLVADLLRAEGFEVHEAQDGRVALDLWRIIRPDLLVLDLDLPLLHGNDVLAKIRHDWRSPSLPVLILTADERDEALSQSLDLGADDFVPKSARPDELLKRVHRALRASIAAESRRTA